MNSYNAPDEVNQVDWDLVTTNKQLVEVVKKLIVLKTSESAFSHESYDKIRQRTYVSSANQSSGIVEFSVNGEKNHLVIFNSCEKKLEIPMTRVENYAIIVTTSKLLQTAYCLEPLTFAILEKQHRD